MISKKTFCMLALAAAPSFVALTRAHGAAPPSVGPALPPVHPGFVTMPPPLMGMFRGVGLTKEQRDEIHGVMHVHRQARRDAMRQRRNLDQRIGVLLFTKGPVDRMALAMLIKEKEALDAREAEAMADDAVAIRNILTSEQLDRARVMRQKLASLEGQIRDLMHPPHASDAADGDDETP